MLAQKHGNSRIIGIGGSKRNLKLQTSFIILFNDIQFSVMAFPKMLIITHRDAARCEIENQPL